MSYVTAVYTAGKHSRNDERVFEKLLKFVNRFKQIEMSDQTRK